VIVSKLVVKVGGKEHNEEYNLLDDALLNILTQHGGAEYSLQPAK